MEKTQKKQEKKISNKEKKELFQNYGDKHNLEVKLKERERLLTEQERRYIVNSYENRDWKIFRKICVVLFFSIMIVSMISLRVEDVKDAVVDFLLWTAFAMIGITYMFWLSNKLLNLVKKNKVYVKEAVFLDYFKYGYGSFEIMKNGKRTILSLKAFLKDEIKVGEKVILVKMGKKYVWVYKAYEDET